MVTIDQDKPLPEHTKLDYYECYAKVILEEFFFDYVGVLKLSDKPDLINVDKSIGIEVTIADDPGQIEAEKLWSRMPYKDFAQQARDIERMRQLGVEYMGGIQTWPSRNYAVDIRQTPVNWVIKAFQSKVKKLNSGNYQVFEHYALFIHSDVWLNDTRERELLSFFIAENSKNMKYEMVFLTTSIDVFVFDLKNETISTLKYAEFKSKQYSLATEARQMVEEGETDDQT